MKTGITAIIFAFSGFFAGVLANPVPAPVESSQLVRRTTNIADIFAQVEAHTEAVLAICAAADVDINASLAVRAAVAAKLKADLDACAALLLRVTAEIKAKARAEILDSNKGCDARCIEKSVVERSTKLCKSIDVVVKKLGEDCVKDLVKPVLVAYVGFTGCLNGIFLGLGLQVAAAIQAVLGVSLSLALGLDLSVLLGLGGLLGIGRV